MVQQFSVVPEESYAFHFEIFMQDERGTEDPSSIAYFANVTNPATNQVLASGTLSETLDGATSSQSLSLIHI